jgi:hypothetical protein
MGLPVIRPEKYDRGLPAHPRLQERWADSGGGCRVSEEITRGIYVWIARILTAHPLTIRKYTHTSK